MTYDYPNPTPQTQGAYRFQLSTVMQSICSSCFHTIAYSPNLDALVIAEKAHKCSERARVVKSITKRAA